MLSQKVPVISLLKCLVFHAETPAFCGELATLSHAFGQALQIVSCEIVPSAIEPQGASIIVFIPFGGCNFFICRFGERRILHAYFVPI